MNLKTQNYKSSDYLLKPRETEAAILNSFILPKLELPETVTPDHGHRNIDQIKDPNFVKKLNEFKIAYKKFKNKLLNEPYENSTEEYILATKFLYSLIEEIKAIFVLNTKHQTLIEFEGYIQDLCSLLLDPDQLDSLDSYELVEKLVIAQNLPALCKALLCSEPLRFQESFMRDLEADIIFVQQLAQKTVEYHDHQEVTEVNLSQDQNVEIQFFSSLKYQIEQPGYQRYAFTAILEWLQTKKKHEQNVNLALQNPQIVDEIYAFAKSEYVKHGYYNFESQNITESQQTFNDYVEHYFDQITNPNQFSLDILTKELNLGLKKLDEFSTKTTKFIYIISQLYNLYGQRLWNLLDLKARKFFDFPKSTKIQTSYWEILRISAQQIFPDQKELVVSAINQILASPNQNQIGHYWQSEAYKGNFTEQFFKKFIVKMHRLLIGEPESETHITQCLTKLKEAINCELDYLKNPYDHLNFHVEVANIPGSSNKNIVGIRTPIIDRVGDILSIDFIELDHIASVELITSKIEKIELNIDLGKPEIRKPDIDLGDTYEFEEDGGDEVYDDEFSDQYDESETQRAYLKEFYEDDELIIPESDDKLKFLQYKLSNLFKTAKILTLQERVIMLRSLKNLISYYSYHNFSSDRRANNEFARFIISDIYSVINDIKHIQAPQDFNADKHRCYYGFAKLHSPVRIIDQTLPKKTVTRNTSNSEHQQMVGNDSEIIASKYMDHLKGHIFTFRSPRFSGLDRNGMDLFCVLAVSPEEINQNVLLFSWLFARILSQNFNSKDKNLNYVKVFDLAKTSMIDQIRNTNSPINIFESLNPYSKEVYPKYNANLMIYPKYSPKNLTSDLLSIAEVAPSDQKVINFIDSLNIDQFENFFIANFNVAGIQVKTGFTGFNNTIQKHPNTPAIYTPNDSKTNQTRYDKVEYGIYALFQDI